MNGQVIAILFALILSSCTIEEITCNAESTTTYEKGEVVKTIDGTFWNHPRAVVDSENKRVLANNTLFFVVGDSVVVAHTSYLCNCHNYLDYSKCVKLIK
jgi:hypothetical protein